MKRIFSVSVISCIIAGLSLAFQWKSIVIFIALISIIFCYKYTEKFFWFIYFTILLLPISNNNILEYITIYIGGKGINALQISVVVIFFIILIKNNQYRKFRLDNYINIIFVFLSILYSIYFIIGLSKWKEVAIIDFSMYIFQMLLFYCTYKVAGNKEDIYKLMNMTLYGLTANSIITFVMFLTNKWTVWGIEYNGERFGGNYFTLYIITISYIVFLLYNKKNEVNRTVLLLSSILSVILMFISQNRTNPILLIITCGVLLIINLKNKLSLRNILIKLSMLIFITIFSVLGIYTLIHSDSEFINRFKNISSLSQDRNIQTRIKTINYHMDLVEKNPLGNGFGTFVPYIDAEGRSQYEDSLNIDNSYINIARKTGVITLILYIAIILSPTKSLIKKYKNEKDMIHLSILVSYLMLLVASSIMTSQSIHSYAVSSFIWVFISYMNVVNID